jgi:multidrug efflux pump subunit AcrA (membrane-fusion protein)
VTKRLILLLLLGLSLVVAALWYHHSRSRDRGERYALAPFEWGALCEATTATGELQPRDAIVVCSPLSGQVVEVYPGADVNREVREGDPLLKLDDRLAAAKLEQAETAVRAAQADLDRVVALRDAARIGLSRQRDRSWARIGAWSWPKPSSVRPTRASRRLGPRWPKHERPGSWPNWAWT